MGMCAIYTAIRPPSEQELAFLAKKNEAEHYGRHRKTMGRRAMLELVALVAPPSRTELANIILDRDLWSFVTPAASRGNHGAALQHVHEDIVVPFPLWPESTLLACLTGAEPAQYLGNNLVMLPPHLVSLGVAAFEKYKSHELVAFFLEFLRDADDREDAILLHWDHR